MVLLRHAHELYLGSQLYGVDFAGEDTESADRHGE
jgi:hypothetical protein